ncbi:MAG: ROK family protein [Defluviitaleaceae bacterium]|nr:ROK family protein [Defluviitaleaceae bacterium]
MKKLLAIDAGGGSLKYGLYDNEGNVLDQGGQIAIVCDDTDMVLKSFEEAIEGYESLDGIALSLPGVFERDTGVLIESGAISGLMKVTNFRSMLEEKYRIPVSLENDANCAALAEHWLGNGRDCDNLICITIGTGIGGGIIINGALHKGSHGRSGEFHGMLMYPDSRALFGGTSTASIVWIANNHTSLEIANGKEFFDKIDDPQIAKIYSQWINNLSWGIYNLATAIDPQKVLLGGGVSVQKRFYEDIPVQINKIARSVCNWTVEPCFFGNDAGKIGAVYNLLTTRFGQKG